ncbi:MAG: inositol monophosphatase family protein [Candidatus Omnitrophota bacterium]
MEETRKIRDIAAEVVRETGKIAFQNIGELRTIEYKSARTDLVTDVDKRCESIIIERIRKEYPDHAILAEESGEKQGQSEYEWVVDPLDGTTNYAHRFPVFCVSIGVKRGDEVEVGVVYDPSRDELFEACRGKGALLNGSPIKVSSADAVRDSLLATGFAYNVEGKIANLDYFKRMLESAQAVRRLGSAAIDLCYVACGRLDGFWELGLNPWDMAAAQLIVKEAGGMVTTMKGGQFDISKDDILASNGRIHEEMTDLFTNL